VVDLWLDLKTRADKGGFFLPHAGGLLDQPAAMMDAFGMLDWMLARDEADPA
jgi:hypothetical protein